MECVGVIGVGSIGSVLAQGLSELGHDVLINDTDPEQTDRLAFDAVSKDRLARECEVVFVAVPTPTDDHGGDASAVEAVVGALAHVDVADPPTVVLRSTMPPGETGRLVETYGIDLVYSPEFLRDRSDVSDFFDPDRVVLAGPAHKRGIVRSVLDKPSFDAGEWISTADYLTAELAKEAHNAFFATKVSFANQMRAICEAGGADPETVMDIVSADGRNTTSHLDPMLGPFGGKCLPKDTEALTHYAAVEQTVPTPLLDGTLAMNDVARDEFKEKTIAGTWPNVRVNSD